MPRSASPKDIITTLNRVRDALQLKQGPAARSNRNINLGLERIAKAIPQQQPWKGIHVGGTNGKGSIIAYLSALFKLAGISHGTYTSPAFPERCNGVSINGLYVNKRLYEMERSRLPKLPKKTEYWTFSPPEDEDAWYHQLTPFEKDTAAAFRVFNRMRVKYGIVEVGMGGATDATNAMIQKSVTVLGKIGLDHQEYLGNTVEEIAKVKAGIMRIGVPCIVDATNSKAVLDVITAHAQQVRTSIVLNNSAAADKVISRMDRECFQLEPYQESNLRSAVLAFQSLFPSKEIDINSLLRMDPKLPGRLDWIDASAITGEANERRILVDGAHNMLGFEALVAYVNKQFRSTTSQPVTWIMSQSFSPSKPFVEMIQTLLQPQDSFAFVEYTPGENEPGSARASLAVDVARTCVDEDSQVYDGHPEVAEAIKWAASKIPPNPIIITGSLYMIRELYSLQGIRRSGPTEYRKPGRSQLWRYTKAAQQRTLSEEEKSEFDRARQHWYYHAVRNPVYNELHEKDERDLSDEEIKNAQTENEEREELKAILHEKLRSLTWNIVLEEDGLRDPSELAEYNTTLASQVRQPEGEDSGGLENDELTLYTNSLTTMSLSDLYQEQDRVLRQWEANRYHYNRNLFLMRTPGEKWLSYEEVFGVSPRWPSEVGVSKAFVRRQDPLSDLDSYFETEAARRKTDLELGRDPEAWMEQWPNYAGGEDFQDDDVTTRRSSRYVKPPARRRKVKQTALERNLVEEWGDEGGAAHAVVDRLRLGRRLNIRDEVAERRRRLAAKKEVLRGGEGEFDGEQLERRPLNRDQSDGGRV